MRPLLRSRSAALLTAAVSVLLLGACIPGVAADTEQAQVGPFLCFKDALGTASEEAAAHLAASWPVLRAASFPSTFTLPISPQSRRSVGREDIDSKLGAWIVLELLASSNAHTLRAAWPGSYPAEITLTVFDTESMLNRGGMETTINDTRTKEERDQPRDLRLQRPCRRAYAQVIAWRKGVHTPKRPAGSWPAPQDQGQAAGMVPLHLTLEPLLLGAVPRTAVVFLIATLLPLLAVAWWVLVPLAIRWTTAELERVAAEDDTSALSKAKTE